MDCREFHELISEAVDKRLHTTIAHQFNDHAGVCPFCRNEFEMEQLTELVLAHKSAAANVRRCVRLCAGGGGASASPSTNWLTPIFGEAFLNPAVALVALLLVAVGAISLLQKNNAIP